MASPRWGKKHTCLECGAAFYDMQRSPMACPKCGTRHEPVVLLKSDGRPARKSRGHRPAPAAVVAEADEKPTETKEDDGEILEIDDEAETDSEPEDDGDEGAAETDDQDR